MNNELEIYKAKNINNQKRKYTIKVDIEDLFDTRSIIIPKSVDNIRDCWDLFSYDVFKTDEDREIVNKWLQPFISKIIDQDEYKDLINNAIDECVQLKIESRCYDVIMNAIDDVYHYLEKPLISDLQNWYENGSLVFYLSQKQIDSLLNQENLSMKDFDNDHYQVQDHIQQNVIDLKSLNTYSFDTCYHEFLQNSEDDKQAVLDYFNYFVNRDIAILKGDKFEQLEMVV